jgi:hypothetical protein
MLAIIEEWYKLGGAIAGFFLIIITSLSNWKKEEKQRNLEIEQVRQSQPDIMQAIAASHAAPMPALYVDQINDFFKAAEELTLAMKQLIGACERHTDETRRGTEETRRAAEAAARQAEEARRLQDVINQASREAAARDADRSHHQHAHAKSDT